MVVRDCIGNHLAVDPAEKERDGVFQPGGGTQRRFQVLDPAPVCRNQGGNLLHAVELVIPYDQSVIDKPRSPKVRAGDLLLFAADKNKVVWDVLGALRLEIGRQLGLMKKDDYQFLWVTEFPLLEWSDEENRFKAMHHPFTMPMEEDWDKIDSDPGAVRAKAYDIVLNGTEIGGGSVRIHQADIQEKMFEVLGLTREVAEQRFGFLLEAFKYGVPPHAGLAYGLDRVVMLMVGADTIRDVIAFPKVKDASDMMMNAPDTVEKKQLDELAIRFTTEQE